MFKFAVKARCYQKIQITDAIHTLHRKKFEDMWHYAIARDIRRKFLKDREEFK